MLSHYYNLSGSYCCYLESNFFILFSKLGILKIKNHLFFNFYYFTNQEVNSLISSYYNRSFSLYLKDLFLIINYGYFNKFKLIGVGYKQFYINNVVVYKLRYSHLIYKVLPFNLISFKKHKKKKFYTIFGLNKTHVNSIIDL